MTTLRTFAHHHSHQLACSLYGLAATLYLVAAIAIYHLAVIALG